jgi:hypothetical protein
LKNHTVTTRRLVLFSALLLFANGAHGGTYQRTTDGKTLVWNDHPRSGEEPTWTGKRDAKGYAVGDGTVTWYRIEKPLVTGSSIRSARRERTELVVRYSGRMVRGKFDGLVERVDADGRTLHSGFVNGSRATEWVVGGTPQGASRSGYQRTKDGRTLVWNENPGWDYEATWTGERDSAGYATGKGTLTWYQTERPIVTGSNIPSGRKERTGVVASYSGQMVRGQLEGLVVSVDAAGRTFHSAFVKGSRSSDWTAGPAPEGNVEQRRSEPVQEVAAVETPVRPGPVTGYRRAEPVEEEAVEQAPSPALAAPPVQDKGSEGEAAKAPGPDQGRNETVPRQTVVETPTPALQSTPAPPSKSEAVVAKAPAVDERRNERIEQHAVIETPTPALESTPAPPSKSEAVVAKAPAVDEGRNERIQEHAVVEAPTRLSESTPAPRHKIESEVAKAPAPQGDAIVELMRPPSSLRTPVVAMASPQASVPSANSAPGDSAAKLRMIADFKRKTQSLLMHVGNATANFHKIDRLDSVRKLPAPVSEGIATLVDRARDFHSKIGDEGALPEYQTEAHTVAALFIVDQITGDIAEHDAFAAKSRVEDFLTNNPEPSADSQKALWGYLASARSLCSRLEKEADVHTQRAESLASAGKTDEAIKEYQQAERIFPNPATAQKIRQLPSSQSEPRHP